MFPTTVLGSVSTLIAMTYYEPTVQPFLLQEVILYSVLLITHVFCNYNMALSISNTLMETSVVYEQRYEDGDFRSKRTRYSCGSSHAGKAEMVTHNKRPHPYIFFI